ncbi:MAG: FAD-dependent oxidoreductase [Acidisphaera sp.]|nr:FAD-dependent oxidoreductase [Acidisphaera sp.]
MAASELSARCCIAGGGPAGMMLGFLLARAGIDVLVLEKHADFLRDFRGDTIHPSTLEIMHELGLLQDFLARPHQEVRTLGAQIGKTFLEVADFRHLPTRCRFIAFMPQWDFLDFIAEHARRLPCFRLLMQAEATELIEDGDRVVGLRARTPQGTLTVKAGLVVGADGRHSTVRAGAGLASVELGAPMDVLWMRLSRRPGDPEQTLGRIDAGRILVMLNREDYWQCALVIEKGGFETIRRSGLSAFREEIVRLAPYLGDRVAELRDWEEIKLLTVAVDRLARWYRPGLLCIGDAAHAMSPIGGVGINLAVQDAVAAARILAPALHAGAPDLRILRQVQRRREFPTRATQRLQLFIQNRGIRRVLGSRRTPGLALPLRLLRRWPVLRRIPARLIGLGFRPEHVSERAGR